jgi:hypothetical protein
LTTLWIFLSALVCPLAMAAVLWVLLRPARGHDSSADSADLRRDAAAFRAHLTAPDYPTTAAQTMRRSHGSDVGPAIGTTR